LAGTVWVVGLGPGDPGWVTRTAARLLAGSSPIYLRTSTHPSAADLIGRPNVQSFDRLYDAAESFEQVYTTIAQTLIARAGADGEVVYAVPGDPSVGEASVARLRELAADAGVTLRVVPGLSFLEPLLAALGKDALDGLALADALDLASRHTPPFPPDMPAVIGQLHSQLIASDVKLTLMSRYPTDHPVTLVQSAGTPEQRLRTVSLEELDRNPDWDDRTALFVPPVDPPAAWESLAEVVARLRAPDGCPWDKEQTHGSLRRFLLEETYETLHALDREDPAGLREELGDLLLQVLLHAQIAGEGGEFTISDVLQMARRKIIRRHPHVFGDVRLNSVDEVLHHWETTKAHERQAAGHGSLDGVPPELPSLAEAHAVQDRAARVGFDWPDIAGVLSKVPEELRELESSADPAQREAEFGDLLFSLVNAARWMGIDPESALRTSNQRFRRRFGHMERVLQQTGHPSSRLTDSEWEALWQAAKEAEG
jgi:tetrapyrrole methylase family protein/MazG family protein